ncbi:MAG TPA: M20/M25/M40 family metallo-hydrolase [Bryobacteraceae bacterium]|jgi:acetylornithine deacetylase/succinyl-diaminopimelate desuccinylase-like protein
MRRFPAFFALLATTAAAVSWAANDDNRSLGGRTRQYLVDLIRLDTSNPPGNESKVALYLKQVADANGIPVELLGADPKRLNVVARLKGNGKNRPLLLMAHSDVVPAERKQWSVDPFGAEIREEFLYGRGALDTKSLLAAEMAVMVEIKRRNIKLSRDIILLSEADEEAGSSGIEWLIQHSWPKIDAEFAFNEGGSVWESKNGTRVFLVQTAEKIPTRVILTAKGPAGHGSLPRSDNAVLRLSHALVKLAEADQPVRLNATTRRYLHDLSAFPEYDWLPALLPRMDNPATLTAAAGQIRARDPELDAALHTTVTPTMLKAGIKINMIPNSAEGQVDVRRLPSETIEEVLARFRQIVSDPAVEITLAPGPQLPATESSARNSAAYRALERAIARVYPHQEATVPFMSRGATDGSFLRSKGMGVYGLPIFLRENGENREHGNDERISLQNIESGSELLWQMVLETAGDN